MLSRWLIRGFLCCAGLAVVTLSAAPASAQVKKVGEKKKKKKKSSSKKIKAVAGKKAPTGRSGAVKGTAKAVGRKGAVKGTKAAVAAKASAEAMAAKMQKVEEFHAKRLGQIERLQQIATATKNDELLGTVKRLQDKENKRYAAAKAPASDETKDEGADK